ncbi:MAG: acetylglutamate kinase [Pseudomonadota bacterium]|jgi:acetylglutamate kinase
MDSPIDVAHILAHSQTYVDQYKGKTLVIKYGGNAMTDPSLQRAFAEDVVQLQKLGIRPVVVHGGGPQIEQLLQRLGKKGEFIQGMRVTDAETMQVVQWVLAGEVQQTIVGLIQIAGGQAVGLTGRDGGLLKAKPLRLQDQKDPTMFHDVGWVGDIQAVDVSVIHALQAANVIPVISPIGLGENAESFNINADVAASDIAQALAAEKLLLLTNISGVLDQSGQLLKELNEESIARYVADGTISGGMLPKIQGALAAAKDRVGAVHIMDGRVPHALLLEILSDQSVGTMIRA